MAAAPAAAGTASRLRSCSPLARRQGSSGPTPIRNSSSRNTGAVVSIEVGPADRDLPVVVASTNSG